MKIKRIKTPKCFPANRFTDTLGGLKFKAKIYKDNFGWYEMCNRGEQLECAESGKLEHWIDDVQDRISELQRLEEFLVEVNYQMKQPENKL
jgi:hypothetical protein